MWRDEIQAWLLARDSNTPIDLFRHLKYEGHPGVWHLCLMPLSRLTWSPEIMQVFHLLIAATTVYLTARFSPFTPIQKFLFAFGYFPLYEYAIICRNYAPGVLLLCIFCILFQQRYAKFLSVSVVLFLLSHTSVHALIVTVAISGALLMDYLFLDGRVQDGAGWRRERIWIGFGIIALGIVTAALQLNPPADTGFAVQWYTHYDPDRLENVVKLLTRAFFPIPEAKLHFWGSRLLEQSPLFIKHQLRLSGCLVIWLSLVLLRRPTALLMYLVGTIGLLSFFYIKYLGGIRHHGFLFILFITVAWIYRYCDALELRFISRFGALWERTLNPALTLILIVHLLGGVNAVRMESRHVFSYGKAVAAYIRENGLEEMLVTGDRDPPASTIVGYLRTNQIYYPNGNRFGSYVPWDSARVGELPHDQMLQRTRELQTRRGRDALLVLNYPLNREQIEAHHLTELRRFTGATVSSEEFYLYLMPFARP